MTMKSIVSMLIYILPVVSIILSISCFYIYYRMYIVMGSYIKRAFSVMGEKSGVSKREAIQKEKIDDAVQDIIKGMATDNPTVNLVMNIIEEYTDLEVTPDTILALIEHPTVNKMIKNLQLAQENRQIGDKTYGQTKYQLK